MHHLLEFRDFVSEYPKFFPLCYELRTQCRMSLNIDTLMGGKEKILEEGHCPPPSYHTNKQTIEMTDQPQHQEQQHQEHDPITVRIFGHQWNDCGYCKGQRAALVGREATACSKAFHILVSTQLSTAQYEEFVNQGWRRCGVVIYKPENWQSCCPQISIRLPVQKFVPTRSQRKVIKKMEAALRKPAAKNGKPKAERKASNKSHIPAEIYTMLVQKVRQVLMEILKAKDYSAVDADSLLARIEFKEKPSPGGSPIVIVSTSICAAIAGKSKGTLERGALCTQVVQALGDLSVVVANQVQPESDKNNDPPSLPHKRSREDCPATAVMSIIKVEAHAKSGQILVHLQTDHRQNGHDGASPMEEDVADRLASWWARQNISQPLSNERKLDITTLPAHESALDPSVYRLYALYQHKVHGDADPFMEDISKNGGVPDPWNGQWGKRAPKGWMTNLRQALEEDLRSLPLERQQHVISHFVQFYEFLVENAYPLENTKQGTFHQQYRVNGVLIAVGIVDVLPQGLSSVYVFYDPDFCHAVAPLGKFTVLKEIQWAQEHGLPYYYLGYYIESCGKMRYKADYAPSDLLCPRTARWVPASEAQQLIKEKSPERHCCAFVPEVEASSFLFASNFAPVPPRLKLEVGLDRPISWQELPPEATSVLGPFVQDFCKEAGPSLANQVILDFH